MPDRTCATCDTDISHLHGNTRYCEPCRPYEVREKPRKSRYCEDCGTDISHLHGLAVLCGDCRIEVMRVANLEPQEPYPGSRVRWRCRCTTCGDEVAVEFGNIRAGWGGCHTCGVASRVKKRLLPEEEAVASMREAGLEPQDPYVSVMTPWRSLCMTCGGEASPLLNNIRKGQTGCGWCSGRLVNTAERADDMRKAGLKPLESYPGRHVPWQCQCMQCGAHVSPTYGAVCYGGGCFWCRVPGFKGNMPAIVYLVTHADYRSVKVGIGAADGGRLRQHARYGWVTYATVEVLGNRALAIETAILRWWRLDLGLPPHLTAPQMPQKGWTETVDAEAIDIDATFARIQRLAASD